jgi:hypothetical protein
MTEANRIYGQFKSICVGPGWHGNSLAENLQGVTAAQAARHPIPGAHSIWEIVNHIKAWEHKVTLVLSGDQYETMQGDDDWPPVKDTSDQAWQATLTDLAASNKSLGAALKSFPEENLEKPVPGRDFPWYVLLHGMAHHSVYHSGQIAMLRKASQ